MIKKSKKPKQIKKINFKIIKITTPIINKTNFNENKLDPYIEYLNDIKTI